MLIGNWLHTLSVQNSLGEYCTEVNRLSYGSLLDPRLVGDSFTFHWTKIIQVTFFLGAGANLCLATVQNNFLCVTTNFAVREQRMSGYLKLRKKLLLYWATCGSVPGRGGRSGRGHRCQTA
eukprot:scaffold37132_cov53-Attheya_sp.AAC.2